jgi:hypothetical protein
VLVAGLLALYLGFLAFDPGSCRRLVRASGYYWMLGLVLGAIYALCLLWREQTGGLRRLYELLRLPLGCVVLMLSVWAWLLRADSPGYKILWDEPVQLATAQLMHRERVVGAVTCVFVIQGVPTVLRDYIDKRPPMFPFLVATAHDLLGEDPANAWLVNFFVTGVLLYVLAWSAIKLGRSRRAAVLALLLVATLPMLAVSATSAGMDLLNVTLLMVLVMALILFTSHPSQGTSAWLVAVTLLLAYTRYESVLYVIPVGLVWLGVCWGERRWICPVVWAFLPLGLIFYAWHHTVLENTQDLWELPPELSTRFDWKHVPDNLEALVRLLFSTNGRLQNSLGVTVLGFSGLACLLFAIRKRGDDRLRKSRNLLFLLLGPLVLNLGILMLYFWGNLDDPVATRLALPLMLWLILTAVAGWAAWRDTVRVSLGDWRFPIGFVVVVFLVFTLPAAARDRYTSLNLMRKNLEWEQRFVSAHAYKPDLYITNRSAIPWLVQGQIAISIDRARIRGSELAWHVRHHSFPVIWVAQRVLTEGASGEWAVDPSDMLPAYWELETIAVRRVGFTLTRISRVLSINPPGELISTIKEEGAADEEQ